jgi:hypothetical protein
MLKKPLVALTIFTSFLTNASSTTITGVDLPNYGDGFNIEGGKVAGLLSEKQLWGNLNLILDRPFIEGKTLKTITEENNYPLKESSLLSFNDHQALYAYLLCSDYMIDQGRSLLKKEKDDSLNLLIHIHRNRSATAMQDMIETAFDNYYLSQDNYRQTQLDFQSGYVEKNLSGYKDYDIVFSLSLMGGLNPQLKSGTLTLSHTFIPFDEVAKELKLSQKYSCSNLFLTHLDDLLKQQNNKMLDSINDFFESPNPFKKGEKAIFLKKEDLIPSTVLQITDLWYPTQEYLEKTITIS